MSERPSRRQVMGLGAAGVATAVWVAPTILTVDVAAASTSACKYGFRVVNPGSIPTGVTTTPAAPPTAAVAGESVFGTFGAARGVLTVAAYTALRDLTVTFTGLPAHTTVTVDFRLAIPTGQTWDAGPYTGVGTADDLQVYVGATLVSFTNMNTIPTNSIVSRTTGGVAHTASSVTVGWHGRVTSNTDEKYGLRDIVLRVC